MDEYVCFDDDANSQAFKTLARVDDIVARAKADGKPDVVKEVESRHGKIVIKPY